MKNIINVLSILLLSLTIFSCAKKSNTSSTIETTEVEGTWSAACYLATDNLSSTKRTITISGTDVIFKSEVHTDSSCNTDALTWEDRYSSLSIGDSISFDSGATGHQYTVDVLSFTLIPQTTDLVSYLNDISYCGNSDWALDNATDYTGKTCSETAYDVKNTTYLSLYKLVGNNLFLSGFNSTGTYPTVVSNSIIFIKQ